MNRQLRLIGVIALWLTLAVSFNLAGDYFDWQPAPTLAATAFVAVVILLALSTVRYVLRQPRTTPNANRVARPRRGWK